MKKENKWNKDDIIITLYFNKYGTKHLSPIIKSDIDLSENMIGCTLDVLKTHSNDIGNIINKKDITIPKLQKTVIDEFNVMSEKELRKEVLQIINDSERKVIIEERTKLRKEKEVEDKKKEDKKKLDAIFRKMGKDPSKMRFVGIRPIEEKVEVEEIGED